MNDKQVERHLKDTNCVFHIEEIKSRTDLVSWDYDVIVQSIDKPAALINGPWQVYRMGGKSIDGIGYIVIMLKV